MNIIQYLLNIIQHLYQMNCWLILFICRYIPLRQWAHDDSHSPKYQKFKTDKLPKIIYYEKWDYRDYIPYLEWRYGKKIKPVARRKECDIPDECSCPRCNAPKPYLYKNNGAKGQILCKVCSTVFSLDENRFAKPYTPRCPYCSHALVQKKERKQFLIHKCVDPECPFYLHNLKKVDKEDLEEDYGKNKYKLHYICREFTADETCIKVRSIKGYVWLIMDVAKRSITGYQVSDNRGVGPCILATRMAFRNLKKLPENLRFIADGYSAYPLAAQQFYNEYGDDFKFEVTQVIGLSNSDEVSKEFCPYKQIIERVNRDLQGILPPGSLFRKT